MSNAEKFTLSIDMKKAKQRLTRNINKCIYYNDECVIKLKRSQFMKFSHILMFLYNDYINHKEKFNEYPGMKQEDLAKSFMRPGESWDAATIRIGTNIKIRTLIYYLIPQFINCVTRGKGTRVCRLFKLNRFGIELVEEMLAKQENTTPEQEGLEEDETTTTDDTPI